MSVGTGMIRTVELRTTTRGGASVRLQIHPSKGIGDLRFGMTFQDAVMVAAQYGEPKLWPGAPARPGPPALPTRSPKASVDFAGFGLHLGSEDWVHLTCLEVWGPGEGVDRRNAGVTFEYEGIDVFATPVRELTARLKGLGRNVLWGEEVEAALPMSEASVLIPEETFLVSRETSQDMEPDPQDGLPLYAMYVLVGPKNYYARADAWLSGEALYADDE